MPVTEKIGLGITLLLAVLIIVYSLFCLMIDLTVTSPFDLFSIVIDLIVLAVGIVVGHFAFRIYKKSVYYEELVRSAFDEGIYARLEPVLRKVAETHVEMENLEDRIDIIDRKVQTVIEEQVRAEKKPELASMVAPGTSMGFVVKAIFLTIITMSGFLSMIYLLPGFTRYATLAFYILWWLLITSEFKLFDDFVAWIMVFVPIFLIPFSFMLLDFLVGVNMVIAIFYVLLALYAFLYYSWALYEKKGTLPFNFGSER